MMFWERGAHKMLFLCFAAVQAYWLFWGMKEGLRPILVVPKVAQVQP